MPLSFDVVPGRAVSSILEDRTGVLDVVRSAYLLHGAGRTTNPDSYFLRFPDRPSSRIIALPARVDLDERPVAGIKWISSFPENVTAGLPRASAVLLLNDMSTGYPYACLEAAGISAARTAASIALVTVAVGRTVPAGGVVGCVGAGVIARTTLDYLVAAGVEFDKVVVHDTHAASAAHLVTHAEKLGLTAREGSLADVLECQTVLTATTALAPYIDQAPAPGQVYLNVSLRDFTAAALRGVQNVVDDVDHCLKAGTSPHLLETASGSRDFITGTIPALLAGDLTLTSSTGVVVSPFGLGVLDLAVGEWVHRVARERDLTVGVDGFFGEEQRW